MNARTYPRSAARTLVCLALLLFGCLAPGPATGPTPAEAQRGAPDREETPLAASPTVYLPAVHNQHAAGLIQPTDLHYEGAFRLPPSPGTPEDVGWEWGGTALAYRADGDPEGPADGYPGSLIAAGHEHTQYVSEVEIPVPVLSARKDPIDLNVARTLQNFANVRGSLYDGLDWEMPRVGLAVAQNKLHFCWSTHAPGDPEETGPTHGWCELDLANPRPAGAWRIDGYSNYVTSDYLFPIPAAWASAHTPGRYLATGRYRDGGQAAQGPALLAIGPASVGDPPLAGSTLPATPLLLYESVEQDDAHTLDGYHHSDEWSGGAWLAAGGDTTVLFVGTKGQGECWYGCADGTDAPPWPEDCDRGWWSTRFVAQMLFYDPAHLAAVARGEQEPWEPQPYATLNVDSHLYHLEDEQQLYRLGGTAFDPERRLLYVLERLVDEDRPLVHVWRVRG
jgi:hypothetical protein